MRIKQVVIGLLLSTLVGAPASAELRHVELKTLGMD